MFVVRIIDPARAEPVFRSCQTFSDARDHFIKAYWPTHNGAFDSVAIFEVDGMEDERHAIGMVQQGASSAVRLVAAKDSLEKDLAKVRREPCRRDG